VPASRPTVAWTSTSVDSADAARICSAGLPAGCSVDLPVHAALYTNRRTALPALSKVEGCRKRPARSAGLQPLKHASGSSDQIAVVFRSLSNIQKKTPVQRHLLLYIFTRVLGFFTTAAAIAQPQPLILRSGCIFILLAAFRRQPVDSPCRTRARGQQNRRHDAQRTHRIPFSCSRKPSQRIRRDGPAPQS